MSKITQNYIEARRDGIKWLNSQKRDYSTGVNILTRSGYKGFVAARLARQGEKPHTREKLEYEIRQSSFQPAFFPDGKDSDRYTTGYTYRPHIRAGDYEEPTSSSDRETYR